LDTDHYLVVAKVRERLAVSKPAAQNFDGERFLRKLNELEVRKHYRMEVSKRFAALEKLSDSEEINRAWEHIKENIKTSAKDSLGPHELKQNIWVYYINDMRLKCSGYRIQAIAM
jgi:hypothetical protein